VEARSETQSLTLGATRELILPATILGCFGLYYFGEQPFSTVVACAVPMLALYALAPLWASRSLARFDRDSVSLLAARNPSRLRARYRRALGLRLFAPPALRAERRAMVLLECGDAHGARECYREVIDELGSAAPPRVVLGCAHASFATGDDATAIALYRRVLDSVGALPGVERKLAHALVRQGEDLRAALEIFERTERELDPEQREELTLLRALAFAKLGESARAKELLGQAGPGTAASADLRAEIGRRLDGAVVARV
jgi:hypothetical protein